MAAKGQNYGLFYYITQQIQNFKPSQSQKQMKIYVFDTTMYFSLFLHTLLQRHHTFVKINCCNRQCMQCKSQKYFLKCMKVIYYVQLKYFTYVYGIYYTILV